MSRWCRHFKILLLIHNYMPWMLIFYTFSVAKLLWFKVRYTASTIFLKICPSPKIYTGNPPFTWPLNYTFSWNTSFLTQVLLETFFKALISIVMTYMLITFNVKSPFYSNELTCRSGWNQSWQISEVNWANFECFVGGLSIIPNLEKILCFSNEFILP